MSAMSTPPPKPSRHNPPRMPPTGTYSTPPSIWSPNSLAARSTHIRYQDVLGAPAHQVAAIIDGTHLPGGVRPASRFYRSRARRRSRRCSDTPCPWSCRPIPRSMRSPSAWGTLGRNAGGRSRSSREGRSPNRPGAPCGRWFSSGRRGAMIRTAIFSSAGQPLTAIQGGASEAGGPSHVSKGSPGSARGTSPRSENPPHTICEGSRPLRHEGSGRAPAG